MSFSLEALQNEAEGLADALIEDDNVDEFIALKERLGFFRNYGEVMRKPVFFMPGMHQGEWTYDHDVQVDEDYASFQAVNRALVREIRRAPEMQFLYDNCSHVVLDCFKEGSIEGIYKVSFFMPGGGKVEGVLQVGKSERQNELVDRDAKRLKLLEGTGCVPKVYANGQLAVGDSSVHYKFVQYLPSREISVHAIGNGREFHFLEGDESTGVAHDVMGNKMMETVFKTMFSNPEVICVPQMLRGDLVYISDASAPDEVDKAKVMLISTANALTLLDSGHYQKLHERLSRNLTDHGQSALTEDVFSMIAAIENRYDSTATDAAYHCYLAEDTPGGDEEISTSHLVYPYSALNLLHGLVNVRLDDEAFVRASSALLYALWFMTQEGKRNRTHPMLTELCMLYNELDSIWRELHATEDENFAMNLRTRLRILCDEKQHAFSEAGG